jgi:hypothetical protein
MQAEAPRRRRRTLKRLCKDGAKLRLGHGDGIALVAAILEGELGEEI